MATKVCDILNESLYGTSADFEDFRPALVANCVFNSFLSYTNIFFNIITIHAIRKTAFLPEPLRTLLLSLVATDVGVGLLVQPLYISTLVNRLKEKRIDRIYDKAFSVVINFFCTSSFVNVVTCCNHKCGQVFSCSPSSQISKTCHSQAPHCRRDINMTVKRNYFF